MNMRTVAGEVHRDLSRDSFWTRVRLVSDERNVETEVLLCASYEYLSKDLAIENLDDHAVSRWVTATITDIQNKGEILFEEPVHLEVRAITSDGYENGISFLREKVAHA